MNGQISLQPTVSSLPASMTSTRGDRALWEARRAGIPLKLTLVDGQVVLRASGSDGARLRLTGPADMLADLVGELAGRLGIRLDTPRHAPRGGEC